MTPVQKAARHLPELVRCAKQIHRSHIRRVLAVLDAWRALAGVSGWTPAMVTRVEREVWKPALRALVLIALLAGAAPAATTITDTLYYADGRKADGRITITWGEFTAAGPRTIAAGQVAVVVKSGAFTIALEANDTATPAGTSYAARYFLSDGTTRLENWVVPTSATPVTIASIRANTIPTPALRVLLTQLDQGGATLSQLLAWNGTRWAPTTPAGTGITSLGGQTGATQTFANDTNVTISSALNVHTLGWAGALAKARQHAQTAYYDNGGTFTQPQTISGTGTDLFTMNQSGASDWVTLLTNKTRFKFWNTTAPDLAEVQALGFFGSGAGLNTGTVPTAALVASADYPSSSEKAALAGTSGTPSGTNKYVTDADARNTNARAPTAHASTHKNAGGDEVAQAAAAANAIPKAGAGGRLGVDWSPVLVDTADKGFVFIPSINPPDNSGATSVFTANNHKVFQLVLPFPATVNQLTFEVVAASGAATNLGLGIWDAACSTLVLNSGVMSAGGTPDINVVGVKTKTISGGPVTINPGVYWLAMTTDSTLLTLRSLVLPSNIISQLNNQTNKKYALAGNAGTAGAFPASCGTVTTANNNNPPVFLLER